MEVELTGWSPFEPGDADNACLPVAALEYRFTNRASTATDAVFSFNSKNFMAMGGNAQAVRPIDGGFILWYGAPARTAVGGRRVFRDGFRPGCQSESCLVSRRLVGPVDHGLAAMSPRAPAMTRRLRTGRRRQSRRDACSCRFNLRRANPKPSWCAWRGMSGQTNLRRARIRPGGAAAAGFTARGTRDALPASTTSPPIGANITMNCAGNTQRFSDCFYDSTLPPEVHGSGRRPIFPFSNRPPSCGRRTADCGAGKGCDDDCGLLLAAPARTSGITPRPSPIFFRAWNARLRETEFGPSQNEAGHQTFRSALPIRPVSARFLTRRPTASSAAS